LQGGLKDLLDLPALKNVVEYAPDQVQIMMKTAFFGFWFWEVCRHMCLYCKCVCKVCCCMHSMLLYVAVYFLCSNRSYWQGCGQALYKFDACPHPLAINLNQGIVSFSTNSSSAGAATKEWKKTYSTAEFGQVRASLDELERDWTSWSEFGRVRASSLYL